MLGRPRLCPITVSSMFSMGPKSRPLVVIIRPADREILLRVTLSVEKHRSIESGVVAAGMDQDRARARMFALDIVPMGRRRRDKWAPDSIHMT